VVWCFFAYGIGWRVLPVIAMDTDRLSRRIGAFRTFYAWYVVVVGLGLWATSLFVAGGDALIHRHGLLMLVLWFGLPFVVAFVGERMAWARWHHEMSVGK